MISTDAYAGGPRWRAIRDRLRRSPGAMAGLLILCALHAGAILAGFLAPYPYDEIHEHHGFHPPMIARIHLFDDEGRWSRPFIYGIAISNPAAKGYAGYAEDRTRKYPIRLFVRGGGDYRILGLIRTNRRLFGVDAPGLIYLFGSDQFGRDLFSRLLAGSQISLSAGLAGALISMSIGAIIGGVAGYCGGKADFLAMRLVELMLAVPSLYAILILRRSFGDDLSPAQTWFLIVVILSLIGWATQARVIRGIVLSLREQQYVLAARALGAGPLRILLRHILPNTFSFVLVTAPLSVPFFILSEAAVSFLGLGIQEPEPSWGNLLASAQNLRALTDFNWLLLPGLFIFLAALAWNQLGDALRDAADPRGRHIV
jgi:peptide/nickel transport system permease protein